jgi:hypothetical protein
MEIDELADVIAAFSDREPRLGYAADLILAEYSVPRRMLQKLARNWLIEEIDRHRNLEAYAEEDDE